MKTLRVVGLLMIAVYMMACQGGGGSGSSGDPAVDMSKLKGSWQAVAYKDAKGNSETKADEEGYLGMPDATVTSSNSIPVFMKMFVTFDGSKTSMLVVLRGSNYSTEDIQSYHVEGSTLVSKSDESSKENRKQITNLNSDTFEMKDDNGSAAKFKRVADAVVQSARAKAVSVNSGPNKNGCVPQQGFSCSTKPNLMQGLVFTVQEDINLVADAPENYWNYYVNGQRVDKSDLAKKERQDFCAITISSKYASPHELELPKEFQKNGINQIPKIANPYVLGEISWYVATVFFKGKTPSGESVGFVVYCGTVLNGDVNGKDITSLEAIQKHFTGLISLGR